MFNALTTYAEEWTENFEIIDAVDGDGSLVYLGYIGEYGDSVYLFEDNYNVVSLIVELDGGIAFSEVYNSDSRREVVSLYDAFMAEHKLTLET